MVRVESSTSLQQNLSGVVGNSPSVTPSIIPNSSSTISSACASTSGVCGSVKEKGSLIWNKLRSISASIYVSFVDACAWVIEKVSLVGNKAVALLVKTSLYLVGLLHSTYGYWTKSSPVKQILETRIEKANVGLDILLGDVAQQDRVVFRLEYNNRLIDILPSQEITAEMRSSYLKNLLKEFLSSNFNKDIAEGELYLRAFAVKKDNNGTFSLQNSRYLLSFPEGAEGSMGSTSHNLSVDHIKRIIQSTIEDRPEQMDRYVQHLTN